VFHSKQRCKLASAGFGVFEIGADHAELAAPRSADDRWSRVILNHGPDNLIWNAFVAPSSCLQAVLDLDSTDEPNHEEVLEVSVPFQHLEVCSFSTDFCSGGSLLLHFDAHHGNTCGKGILRICSPTTPN
jgi:hypothetical protein